MPTMADDQILHTPSEENTPSPLTQPPQPEVPATAAGSYGGSGKHRKLRSVLATAVAIGIVGSVLLFFTFADTPNEDLPDSPNAIAANQLELQTKRETIQIIALAKKLQQSPSDATLIQQLTEATKNRKATMLQAINSNPELANSVHIPGGVKKNLPDAVKANIEEEVELSGKLTVLHGEQYDTRTKKLTKPFYRFEITDASGGKSLLHFEDFEAAEGLAGATVKVRGVKLAGDTAVDSSGTTTIAPAAIVPATTKKTAVLMVNFSDNKTQPWTADQVRNTVFGTTAPSDHTFFSEQSLGKVGLAGKTSAAGDVVGWYTVSDTAASCPAGGDYGGWGLTVASHANAAATAAGVDLSGYDNFIYATPSTACSGYAGWAYINGNQAWITGYGTDARVIAHELGHNFGTHHASTEDCKSATGARVSISGTCSLTEYGDPYDVMGYPFYHMNLVHKVQAGYISPTAVPNVANSGTYTVAPLETASSSPQGFRIAGGYLPGTSTPAYYYVEFRQPFGYDSFATGSSVTQGVLIHQAPDYTNRSQSRLIDATPATPDFTDAALPVGATFTDPATNISIKTVSVGSTGATVSVTLGTTASCVRANPTVGALPKNQNGSPAQALSFTLTVQNNDTAACGSSTFGLTSSGPSGFTQTPASSQVSVAPGASVTVPVTITSTNSVTAGFYAFTNTVKNNAATSYVANADLTYTISTADTIAPTVTLSSPANGSTIAGKTVIAATSNDNVAVASMEIWIDGQLRASNTSGSISYTWNVNKRVTKGTHTIIVKAYDTSGNLGQQQATVTK